MLQITSIEIYKLLIPLKEPFVISLGTQFNADNVLIVIKTNEELIGWGECSPYMSINGESVETCFAVAQYLAKVLIGKNPTEIEDCIVAMDKVIYGNNSIKSAFDMALYDLAAQHKGLPLYKFLGGRKDKIITTDMTVGIGSPEKMAADALRFKEAGFPAIKVKLGQSTEIDVARIKAIRLAVGNELPLRIDANQGWTVPTAIATLQALEPYNIEHCEEPIARWNFMELSKVKQASPIKIMADESCCTQHDANRLATLQACDYFNIKLGKSGGIFNALQIVEAGNNHNIKLQIGSFMESSLATTAFVHFAFCNAQLYILM
jgi:L-alanine-DL-glutamate epimerase-like enolase superfamily enzyme